MLAERESVWNQVWHLPTDPEPSTGEEFLSRPMLKLADLCNPLVRELPEMLYQNASPYTVLPDSRGNGNLPRAKDDPGTGSRLPPHLLRFGS